MAQEASREARARAAFSHGLGALPGAGDRARWRDRVKPCRFNHGLPLTEADVRVLTPEGCICFPDDRDQWLCAQHFIKLVQQSAPYTLLEGPTYRQLLQA